ncbi:hypothetical protein DAEQUDRAFT_577936 [Daedalea quercina L-15889]|uniref:Uncharacterized protein n=1 Tax=Daedalea quercina L-15889 TaxID=1314783 RepID=A0A165LVF2_9APHY|nr:hypothetical protein DAEQUDRAFT_577936 [Daedalea quercina L-15889]
MVCNHGDGARLLGAGRHLDRKGLHAAAEGPPIPCVVAGSDARHLRHAEDRPRMHDPTEKAELEAIVELLLLHVQRWRILCTKTLHSSSLPCPHVDFVDCAETLEQLVLDFVHDNLTAGPEAVPQVGELATAALSEFTLRGAHFRELYTLYNVPFPVAISSDASPLDESAQPSARPPSPRLRHCWQRRIT